MLIIFNKKNVFFNQERISLVWKWKGQPNEKHPNQYAFTRWQEKKRWWIDSSLEHPKWHALLTMIWWCFFKTSLEGMILWSSFRINSNYFWGREIDHTNFQNGSMPTWLWNFSLNRRAQYYQIDIILSFYKLKELNTKFFNKILFFILRINPIRRRSFSELDIITLLNQL